MEEPPSEGIILPTREEFMSTLYAFHKHRGTPLPAKLPQLGHREIDLYKLYFEVISRGGVEEVVKNKNWKEIINSFNFPDTCTNAGYNLRLHYMKFLYGFERKFYKGLPDEITPQELDPATFYKKAKEGLIASATTSSTSLATTPVPSNTNPLQAPVITQRVPPLTIKTTTVPSPQFSTLAVMEAPKGTTTTYKSASYMSTPIPTNSSRQSADTTDGHFQRRIILHLESTLEEEVNAALNILTIKSFEGDVVLKPGYGLLEVLLKHLHKHWSQVANLIAEGTNNDNVHELEAQDAHIQFLERLMVIFVNLSYVTENEKYLAYHAPFISYILGFLWCKEDSLSNLGLQVLCNLATTFTVTDTNSKCLAYLFGFLYHESLAIIATAVSTFARLSESSENMAYLARMDSTFFSRLEELLFLGGEADEIREGCISILYNFVQFGTMKTKVQIAFHTNCIRNMVTLLSYYTSHPSDKHNAAAVKVATILYGLAMENKNTHLFTAYEEFFVNILVTSSSNQLTKVITDTLTELATRF